MWCDTVCRSHGGRTVFGADVWAALDPPPPLYPDVVTLRPGTPSAGVLAMVDDRPGCSVKDSAAELDLSPRGFEILFEAQWIHRDPAPQSEDVAGRWSVVDTPKTLVEWTAAHGSGHTFRAGLLRDASVRFLVVRDGDRIRAGAIANRSGDTVGISNVFTTALDAPWVWATLVDEVARQFPGSPLVGYALEEDLPPALRSGFTAVGPLRVWVRRG